MNKLLYFRLGLDGIKKNRKIYLPYILSVVGTIAVYYLLTYLVKSPALNVMGGGTNMRAILALGKVVMVIFAVIFLFYTNAFLQKRRNKEYALYNILGMNKRNIAKVLGGETLIIGLISNTAGILTGILLSKLFEMALLKLCGYTPETAIYFSWSAVWETFVVFTVFLFVLYIWTCIRLSVSTSIELLRSTNEGEKPPKANWVIGVIGAVVLIIAYYMAVSIQSPVSAMNEFFLAVVLVIISTYMLFIAGSVVMCRLLKNNKNYYYDTKHFVPVSGMMYRMKRNGAGLATICVLSTMVLVMIASAVSLYLGAADSIQTMFPLSIGVDYRGERSENLYDGTIEKIEEKVSRVVKQYGFDDIVSGRMMTLPGIADGNMVQITRSGVDNLMTDNNAAMICIIPLEDYNRSGHNVSLEENEILLHTINTPLTEQLILGDREFRVKQEADENTFIIATNIVKYYCIVVKDFRYLAEQYEEEYGDNCRFGYIYRINNQLGDDENIRIAEEINALFKSEDNLEVESQAEYRRAFMELYGSLVMLGLFLSTAFLSACVLIIYYKQITEGYEDAESYAIMRKVGMTREEIKSGIDSQTLITFFSPLVMAGLHLLFSFPMVHKILRVFGIGNKSLLMLIYGGCFLIYAIFYVFVYRKTVKTYFEIVS